jgi:hypothetical protein
MPPGEKNSCSVGKARDVVSAAGIGAVSIIVSRSLVLMEALSYRVKANKWNEIRFIPQNEPNRIESRLILSYIQSRTELVAYSQDIETGPPRILGATKDRHDDFLFQAQILLPHCSYRYPLDRNGVG